MNGPDIEWIREATELDRLRGELHRARCRVISFEAAVRAFRDSDDDDRVTEQDRLFALLDDRPETDSNIKKGNEHE